MADQKSANAPRLSPCCSARPLHRFKDDFFRCEACDAPIPGTEFPPKIRLGRNQFDLLTGALDGLLRLLVDDPDADAPIAKDPWQGAGLARRGACTGEVWNAIHHARSVLHASRKWEADQ